MTGKTGLRHTAIESAVALPRLARAAIAREGAMVAALRMETGVAAIPTDPIGPEETTAVTCPSDRGTYPPVSQDVGNLHRPAAGPRRPGNPTHALRQHHGPLPPSTKWAVPIRNCLDSFLLRESRQDFPDTTQTRSHHSQRYKPGVLQVSAC